MKKTTLTLEQIETLLVNTYTNSPFDMRNNIVVPNCNWGFLNHEADLLVMTKHKHLTEIEIKRTWSDFMADFKKCHTHDDPKLKHFYYAVPLSIAERVFYWLYEGTFKCSNHCLLFEYSEVTGYTEHNPHECGLIIYASKAEITGKHCRQLGEFCVNVQASKMHDYKVTEKEEMNLLRLLGLRVWGMKKKLAKYQLKEKG